MPSTHASDAARNRERDEEVAPCSPPGISLLSVPAFWERHTPTLRPSAAGACSSSRGDWPGEASVRNFGTLMAGSLTGEWRRRGMESIALYRELSPLAGFHFSPCGSLYQVTTPVEAAILEEFVQLAPSDACRCELLDPSRAVGRSPASRKHVGLTLFFPDDARIEPRSLFRRLIPWLTRDFFSVQYRPATVAVNVWASGGEACVRTADGCEFHARHAIVCNGSDLQPCSPIDSRLPASRLQTADAANGSTGALRLPTTVASGLTLAVTRLSRAVPVGLD